MIEARNLRLAYRLESGSVEVLKSLSFTVERGDFVCIKGPSGSGKSSLFYVLGGLLKPTGGELRIDGQAIYGLTDELLASVRNRKIGFVFQQFHLLPRATVLENILLPRSYRGGDPDDIHWIERARSLARDLGLADLLDRQPSQLSGGQQQRVAIARALFMDADLILADEPTGNLDSRNTSEVLELFQLLNQRGKTVVMITHDPVVAERCSRTIHILDGEIVGADANSVESAGPGPTEIRESAKPPSKPPLIERIRRSINPRIANLRRNKIKSGLSMLGVTIGTASIFSVLTLGDFAKRKIIEGYESIGTRSMYVLGRKNYQIKPIEPGTTTFHSFDLARDIAPLVERIPEITEIAAFDMQYAISVSSGGIKASAVSSVIGTQPDFFRITETSLAKGRFFSQLHVENRNAVCLVGGALAAQLFGRAADPIGRYISFPLQNVSFTLNCRIIGVLAPLESNRWAELNTSVVMPLSTLRMLIPPPYSNVYTFMARVAPHADAEAVSAKILSVLRAKYGSSGVFIANSEVKVIAQMKRFLVLFEALLAAVACISLLVGGIGVSNMMLASLAESYKEIGLRKAVGATNTDIRTQYLLESSILCLIAGLLGMAAGFAMCETLILWASQVVSSIQFEVLVNPRAVAISFVALVSIGVFSGLVPALKAERLEVVEALRAD